MGASLKEYISLLAEIFHNHNRKIDSSTAPLGLPQTGNGAATKTRVTETMSESNSLREHLNTLRWVWVTNRNHLLDLPCYHDRGPAVWIDQVVKANEEAITSATEKVTSFDRKRLREQRKTRDLEVQDSLRQRDREDGTFPARPPLSYNDVESMRPALVGNHDMNNREWKAFYQEATEWFAATKIRLLPLTTQTRLMGKVLNPTLLHRSLVKLKEDYPDTGFFSTSAILSIAATQRDPQLYPRVVQAWEFLRKYVSDSGNLNWGSESACRATTREICDAAEDCGISTAMQSADSWGALVALMNMPEKKMDTTLKRMETDDTSSSDTTSLRLPSVRVCDAVSKEEELRIYRNEGMRKTKEANRRSRTPQRKASETALLTRASNLGCYCCGEFGHVRRECMIDPDTLLCLTCDETGHVAEVCPTTHELYSSRPNSLSRARRPSSERAWRKTAEGPPKKTHPGPSQRSTTPGPATRVIPPEGQTSALLVVGGQTHSPPSSTNQKGQCFHARLPDQNELKMLKVQTWAQKDEAPKQWLRPGSSVLAVCDTGCTKTLVSEGFVDKLGLRMTAFPQGKSPKVCLGNSDTVTPVAGVEFWATKDTKPEDGNWVPRRKISALVLRNLPTTILMSGDDLIALGLLPPDWPNHKGDWAPRPDDPLEANFPADRNLS